jgi:UDP-4-amino-4,6-dideoxy-N-acetyl-beta-L-altrosamine transaminase
MLPYGRQMIDDVDVAAVAKVLKSDFLTTGPAVVEFEEKFAAECAAPHAVACSSGTAALHMAAIASGLKPGDTAIVPAVTFLATATTAVLAGAEIVFSDVDPGNGLMRPEDLEHALDRAAESGGEVRTVFPVHVGGQMADMAAISEIAETNDCRVVEDACHALGTRRGDRRAGDCQESDMAIFSFHPVKTIAMGEGGAVTTRDAALAETLRRIRNHGIVRNPDDFKIAEQAFDANGAPNPWYYEMHEIGLNYRASDILCALGVSQLSKLQAFADKRRSLAARYDAALEGSGLPLKRIAVQPDTDACWHLYTVLIDFEKVGKDRASVMHALSERGVGTQVHYIPLHLQPFYRRRYGDQSLPGAERYYDRCLSLPLFPAMESDDVDLVVNSLQAALGG